MAKKSMVQREEKREGLIQKYQSKRLSLKEGIKISASYGEKIKIYQKLQKLPKNSSPCRKRNRCWQTGRSRAFYRDFGLSRHALRELAHAGAIPGMTKSSW
jgi:small subunit ribosomal protein S14